MIDHLIVLNEAPDLTGFGIEALDGFNPLLGNVDGHRVDVLPVSIIRTEATEETDAELAPGFWFCVRADARLDLPWPIVTVTDSDRADRGEPFVLRVGEGWEWSQLAGRVWPVWAGTEYPFGPDMGPHMLVSQPTAPT